MRDLFLVVKKKEETEAGNLCGFFEEVERERFGGGAGVADI